ncbi:unnamed protein product [Onchocerca flexuosa]|uniref:MPN domain-containing protein n=1 Tax=Onchocerca flexuosa TaxID=387005 RepID=A0A183H217_9BILA|nr:unnamed protein product [Onchocerca flexuosa]
MFDPLERVITGVRLGGVGPLIATSPTPHSDPNLVGIQPIDIHQFSQNPNIWSGMEAMNAQGSMTQPQHASLQPTLQQSSPYAQILFVKYVKVFVIHSQVPNNENSGVLFEETTMVVDSQVPFEIRKLHEHHPGISILTTDYSLNLKILACCSQLGQPEFF